METNKEEAVRCLRIAKNQYGSKNYEAAVRLTKKSLSLYSTDEATEFLVKAEKAAASTPSTPTSNTPPPSTATQEKLSERKKPSSSQQSSDVREILACGTDYYKVLKVGKDCTEVEIKKSYRKVDCRYDFDRMCILNFVDVSLLSSSILIRTRLQVRMKHLNVSLIEIFLRIL